MEVDDDHVRTRDEKEQPEDEGEGDDINKGNNDSSEEESEDEVEAQRIRQGFIVDEDEEEDDEEANSDEERRRRRRKRRKRHHRRRRDRSADAEDDDEDDMQLDEDDLELLADSGAPIDMNRRLFKRRDASPQPSGSKRRNVVASSDEDDLDDVGVAQVQDIQRIWDDARDEEDDFMDDFIEDDEDEDAPMDQEAREALRRQKRLELAERRKATRAAPPALEGLDASAWLEIHDVFGDGHEYDWALGDEEEVMHVDEPAAKDMKYQDVFEPSEIAARYLTEDDDLIRARDTPERLQLATSTFSKNATLSDSKHLTEEDLNGATLWVSPRLSAEKSKRFFAETGDLVHLRESYVIAVTNALRYMFVEEYEVPYIWAHRRDYLCHFDVSDIRNRPELLDCDDLWRIQVLGQKYKSLLDRRRALEQLYDRLGVSDDYFEEEVRGALDSVEVVADASEWLSLRYKAKKQQDAEFAFHDDEEDTIKRQKMPSRISAYEIAKRSVVARLAEGFGISPHQVVMNYVTNQRLHYVEDQELNPSVYAERFADPDPSKAQEPQELLRRARLILATELGKDPILRNDIRERFKDEALISVEPTDRGLGKILETHPYFNFKYLHRKPVHEILESSQFLNILAAESQHLVSVTISLPPQTKDQIEHRLTEAFNSDNFSESARAWNEERGKVVREVVNQFLLPVGVKWVREYIREEAEDFLAAKVGQQLKNRINVAPFRTDAMSVGEIPSILAISWGKGDPMKDAITLVFMDRDGHLREHTKIDNLVDKDPRDEFIDLVTRKNPDVIVIGGFSMATLKLSQRVKECLASIESAGWGQESSSNGPVAHTPVIYTHDDVARLYQHSTRATEEFSTLPTIAKYCVGLARYVQNPLNEFAALGPDISAITFDRKDQHLVPQGKLLAAFEQSMVDVTNEVGVDMNKAVGNAYYRTLLPFISGLGPRKAQALVKKIASLGGNLVNRDQFIKAGLLTTKIFLNAAAFLRIIPEQDIKSVKNRQEEDLTPDPLDSSRIHPEDYELARKMASDALELDEEDVHDEHPSYGVGLIMEDPDSERKLNELNLDDFAISLHEAQNDRKRYTLSVIRHELVTPFAEHRTSFQTMQSWEVLTMLSGETKETLDVGLIVPALIVRVHAGGAIVRLDSGVEGTISKDYLADDSFQRCEDVAKKGSTTDAVVFNVKPDTEHDSVTVELSMRPQDLAAGDADFRKVQKDPFWDEAQYLKDVELLQRKKRADTDRSRRTIKHPLFQNFNSAQAEKYLKTQQRGDLVIRPSSKGLNHLAVTWKVDEDLYQHIDVTEPNADPTGQTVGNQLIVDAKHTYSDLDELIVNHVQAMARRVEELMAHERFKPGVEDELHHYLRHVLAANPAKSMYGFTLNRKKPGHFNLCFLANKNSSIQTWPVRVAPEAYYLFEAAAPGVPELCDAFKVRHLHESQNAANAGGTMGRTPYGAGARTPARAGYATTPGAGRNSVRQPQHYGGATPRPSGWGGTTPAPTYGGPPPSTYAPPPPTQNNTGYQTPRPSGMPPGMNPQRAAMIQQQGGWSSGGTSW